MDYFELCHAMQPGVASKMGYDPAETEPKHLRVGVNSALVSNGALVQLLIDKGVFAQAEYEAKLNEYMEREVKSYKADLSEHFGKPVKLV